GLARARIIDPGFESLLRAAGAQYVYVVDVNTLEGRHWENDGSIEDVATGSAAGPVASLLVRNGLASAADTIVIHQGSSLGRPSALYVRVHGGAESNEKVEVAGPVSL